MALPKVSHRKANSISIGLFFIGLGVLTFTRVFWPWILLAIGVAIVVRQYLRGQRYDMFVSTIIFGGGFVIATFEVLWASLFGVLFTIGGIYLIFREYFVAKERVGAEAVEDAKQEILDEEENVQ